MTSRVLRSSLAASQKSKARVESSLSTLCEAAAQKHDEAETALAALRAACTEDEQEATQAAAAAARARLEAARSEIRASKDAASLAAAASTVEQLGDDGTAVAASSFWQMAFLGSMTSVTSLSMMTCIRLPTWAWAHDSARS